MSFLSWLFLLYLPCNSFLRYSNLRASIFPPKLSELKSMMMNLCHMCHSKYIKVTHENWLENAEALQPCLSCWSWGSCLLPRMLTCANSSPSSTHHRCNSAWWFFLATKSHLSIYCSGKHHIFKVVIVTYFAKCYLDFFECSKQNP